MRRTEWGGKVSSTLSLSLFLSLVTPRPHRAIETSSELPMARAINLDGLEAAEATVNENLLAASCKSSAKWYFHFVLSVPQKPKSVLLMVRIHFWDQFSTPRGQGYQSRRFRNRRRDCRWKLASSLLQMVCKSCTFSTPKEVLLMVRIHFLRPALESWEPALHDALQIKCIPRLN